MSQSIRRRSSSRQLLENLIQVTVQRSLEDAEEVERERRRRTRERQREEGTSPHQQNKPTLSRGSDEEMKPSCCFVQEEDEGFSDWSHRLENRNDLQHFRVKKQEALSMQWEAGRNDERKKEDDEEQKGWQPKQRSHTLQKSPTLGKKEVKQPSCSKVFLSNDPRQQQATDSPAETIPHMASARMSKGVCMVKQEEEDVQQILQKEQRSDNSSNRPTYEDDQEELNFVPEGTKERLAGFEGSQKLAEERPKGKGCKSDEDKNRRSGLSVYSSEEDETLNCYGAMSPTFKKLLIQFYPDEAKCRIPTDGKCVITERTESLRKSANIKKKIPQPLCISKIDKKLQQYTHALEVSTKECKTTSPVLVDVISPLGHKKSLFEAGVAWNQNALSNTSPKECSSGKKSKFVVMAYGKYEKVSDEDGCSDDTNWTG
ncbi:uncharacterized protein LOC144017711 [Festucalex cinctus]